MRLSKPQQQCAVCKRVFLSPQQLISHFEAFHCNRHVSTSLTAAPSAFRHYQNLNRNPNLGFPARNRFDVNYYRSGYFDEHGRFHKGFPPAKKLNFVPPKKPILMDLFPATTSSEGIHTLPLLSQLEQRRPDHTVTENAGANSGFIDLSLRL